MKALDRYTIRELENLYSRRERLESSKKAVVENHSIRKFCENFSTGTGSNSSISDAVGGSEALLETIEKAICSAIDANMIYLTTQIVQLGGEE